MNWQDYEVTSKEFRNLVQYGEPISVPSGALPYNSGVQLWSDTGEMTNAIYDASLGAIRLLRAENPIFSSMPNRDLLLYNDHLLNPAISLVVVDGHFGTGKTSIACSHLVHGLLQEMRGKQGIPVAYLTKPHESLGNSYGHLPGTLAEKTYAEFSSFFQYFDRFGQPYLVDSLMSNNMLHITVFEYLRGRDIDQGWIILDEAQNVSTKEMIAFMSRVGDGAKTVLLGDTSPFQIDKRGNSPEKNGLQFAKEVYNNKKYAAAVEMKSVKHVLRGRKVVDLLAALKVS